MEHDNTQQQPQDVYTVKEVAALLKVSENTIRELCRQRRITHYRIGAWSAGKGEIRIPADSLDAYRREITVPTRS
jgi:excisionase family DNA binding protein